MNSICAISKKLQLYWPILYFKLSKKENETKDMLVNNGSCLMYFIIVNVVNGLNPGVSVVRVV